jgi:hypothetical protein
VGIETLVEDIYGLFRSSKKLSTEGIKSFGQRLADHISHRITSSHDAPTLRMSNLGTPCDRKLWYSVRAPELAEPLPPEAHMKFLFGDILEELILFLAKESGHDVTRQQEEVDLYGVKGHIDGVIDGVLVDVKSASSYSYRKFKEGLRRGADAFGYLTQLGGYREALNKTGRVQETTGDGALQDQSVSKRAAFVAVDKQLGHICVDVHEGDLDQDYEKLINSKRAVLSSGRPPQRAFQATADGKSGNYKLGVECSYCPFKKVCWPGVRTFLYSDGPRFLVRVEREPNVPEAR